jgi:hypothetical protein
MKKLAFSLLTLLSLNAIAQTPQQRIVDYVFYSTRVFTSVELGGNIYSVGEIEIAPQSYNGVVLVQDLDLNMLDYRVAFRSFGSNLFRSQVYTIVPTSDNQLILGGETGIWGTNDTDPWVFKMDPNYNVAWQTFVETTDDEAVPGLIPNTVGGALMVNDAFPLSGQPYGQLINFDNNGDTLWTRKIQSATEPNFVNARINRPASNGDFLIYVERNGSSEIMRMDQNGNYVESFEFQDQFGNPIIISDVTFEDSVSFITGQNSSFEWLTFKVDQNFDVIWGKKFGGYGDAYPRQIIRDSHGNLYGKYVYSPFGTLQTGIIKMDANGDPLMARTYGKAPNSHELNSYFVNINDHILASGSRAYLADKTIYQLCIDTLLNSESCYQLDYEITVFPTPYTISKVNTPTVMLSSLNPDVISVGPYPESTQVNQSNASTYVLDENMEVSIDIFADDCGGGCNGEAVATATGGSPTYSYDWSDGQSGNTASGLCFDDEVIVTAGDQFGCYAQDTVVVPLAAPVTEICLVTVDPTSTKNEVVWEKPNSNAIAGFGVYREVVGNYTLVGYVPYDSLSRFVDNTNGVNPNITSYRYKISTFDTCGYESDLSDYHETIHLTVNQGTGSSVNCIWDNYEGSNFAYNRILRDTVGNGNWEVMDSVAGNVFTWTDTDPAVTVAGNYMIEIIFSSVCTATGKAQDYNSSRSNTTASVEGGPVAALNAADMNFSIYPNPANDQLFIESFESGDYMITVSDLSGRIVLQDWSVGTSQLDVSELKQGTYFITLSIEGRSSTQRFMKL